MRPGGRELLILQLKMLEAFTEAEDWLTVNDLQVILDLQGFPTPKRKVQLIVSAYRDMGLIVTCPKDTLPLGRGMRYKKSGKIAVVYDHN